MNPFKLPSRINRTTHLAAVNLYLFAILIVNDLFGKFSIFILKWVFMLSVIILKVKRFHDINYSGWWVLLLMAPVLVISKEFVLLSEMHQFILLLGIFCGLALFVAPGTKGDNRFGPEPKKASKLEYLIAIFFAAPVLVLNIYLLRIIGRMRSREYVIR